MSDHNTADLCDELGPAVQVCNAQLRDYGGRSCFSGNIATVACRRDNGLVRAALEQPGLGRVLVVDGGGLLDCALVGGKLGQLGVSNGWSGIVIYGAVRDLAELAHLSLGVRALGSIPCRGERAGAGRAGASVRFGDVTFAPDHWLCADLDGLIVLERKP
jgi:regulator of ribonuclease activity A